MYLIAGGKIAAHGTPDELERDDSPWTKPVLRRRSRRPGAVPLSGAAITRSISAFRQARREPRPAETAKRAAHANRRFSAMRSPQVGACGLFLFAILAAIPRSLRHIKETIRQIWFVGAMSLIIIMTCGLFVGMVLGLAALLHAVDFRRHRALGTVVALSLFRELGPVVTALLFAGRAGTSITAEIGLMRATDQLSAMEMMAVDPMAYVVAPRFIAGVDRDAVAGVRVQCARHLRCASGRRELARTRQRHVLVEHDLERRRLDRRRQRRLEEPCVRRGRGLDSEFQGYTTPPTSEGVAYATTRTVVFSSIVVLALDFVMTAFLM